MSTIDYIYRYDTERVEERPLPADSQSARRVLEEGNRMYASWIEHCRSGRFQESDREYVVPWHGLYFDLNRPPRQAPFAVVLGCSDARAPIEMVFGQASNDLFVIRVAGNVLGDVCLGSVDYALVHLAESVRCVVVLGHMGCGAVTETVKAYLHPADFAAKVQSYGVRAIVQAIFVPVKLADDAIHRVWGPEAAHCHEYRDALIHVAVCVNAAQAAFDLRNEVKRIGVKDTEVLYGVFNLVTHQVSMPANPHAPRDQIHVNLAPAPKGPSGVTKLALRMAELMRPKHLKKKSTIALAAAKPNGNP